ncbi:MAG: amino acid ABC transporter substrate-binding protein, partial [Parvularculaceae bacterium]|nr:amino acid ABC transporter substrate-binding protein [Parvularculaceae bacterium]
ASAALLAAGAASAADLAEVKDRGTVRVAVAVLSPFVILGEDGSLSGYEIDATTALGEHLGVTVDYVLKPFCELADAVIDGEADMIASGYSNMPERRRLLGFSLPYRDTEYFLVITRDKAKEAKTLRGLNSKDVTIGYLFGGVSGMTAMGEFPGATLKGYSNYSQIVDALRDGEIDGAVTFEPYLSASQKAKGRKLTIPHEFALTRTIEAYATDKESTDLRDALNAFIIEQDIAGYWDELEKKWFAEPNAIATAPAPLECAAATPQG